MTDIPATTEMQQYTRNTNGRRKRRARRACLTCRSRKVRCDVMQKSPCSNCQWSSCECVVIRPRRSPSKRNKADNESSKQTKTKQVPVEDTRDSLSYPYSPTSSDIEVKDEESRVIEPSYPAIDDIISPLTPVSQLEDEYCFGPRYASNHTDQTSSIAWDYSSATSLSSPASSGKFKKQESDPIIWYAGDDTFDALLIENLNKPGPKPETGPATNYHIRPKNPLLYAVVMMNE
ncbi:Cutinase transcription factor 1 beta [Fusarium agapanthi]|uniref:Cutinase transcription factor 1 beta n=1 Tax=Fusarium agapanthi TaxID=1803897 RepID=A0A9P5B4R4_9HYPO|nr:Cutinase transcription factor 1 beta [Fusarium agapanthi]